MIGKPRTRAEERRQLRPEWKKARRRLMRVEGLTRRQARKRMHG